MLVVLVTKSGMPRAEELAVFRVLVRRFEVLEQPGYNIGVSDPVGRATEFGLARRMLQICGSSIVI